MVPPAWAKAARSVIDQDIRELWALTDKTIGAYANLFTIPDGWTINNPNAPTSRRNSTPAEYLMQAEHWIDLGATMIGGCCGIGPEYIRALSNLHKP